MTYRLIVKNIKRKENDMLKLLMRKPWKKTCGICKVQDVAMIKYKNRNGSHMIFCVSCKRYPERRSFEVIKHYPRRNLVFKNHTPFWKKKMDTNTSQEVRR